ncbi:MAG: esterase YqiA [Colwellia sp.]
MQISQKNILYIHGFNSSPLSTKAEQTKNFLIENYPTIGFFCPQLASSPDAAIAQLTKIIAENNHSTTQWLLMGSSLGGYFSCYLAEKYHLSAVLINPAIKPFELLEDYIGEQINPYTHEVYQVTNEHMLQLKAIEQIAPTVTHYRKKNYLVMVQTGDEVLDYQQAVEKYKYCQLIVQEGGDHSFVGFNQQLPIIAEFFQL